MDRTGSASADDTGTQEPGTEMGDAPMTHDAQQTARDAAYYAADPSTTRVQDAGQSADDAAHAMAKQDDGEDIVDRIVNVEEDVADRIGTGLHNLIGRLHHEDREAGSDTHPDAPSPPTTAASHSMCPSATGREGPAVASSQRDR
jgi:hypothetical protein